MRCKVCGHEELVAIEYRSGDLAAPAAECVKCHAINLDERAARSEKDLDSVRRALAARQMGATTADSGRQTLGTSAILAARVDAAVSEIDVHLAGARVALEFLAQVTEGESAKAVVDARQAIERVVAVVDDLGRECARAVRRADSSTSTPRPK